MGLLEGPHNIIRTVCEFALEEQHGCDVSGQSGRNCCDALRWATSSLDASKMLFIDDDRAPGLRAVGLCGRCRRSRCASLAL